jgi:hypothetical protein
VDTKNVTGTRAAGWCLALIGTAALLAVHAPALLCLTAAVALAGWWCRELDQSAR